MGIMQCSRNGCDTIMCHRYSDQYGYICIECFNELKLLASTVSCVNVEMFMTSEKPHRYIKKDENLEWLEEEFADITRREYDGK